MKYTLCCLFLAISQFSAISMGLANDRDLFFQHHTAPNATATLPEGKSTVKIDNLNYTQFKQHLYTKTTPNVFEKKGVLVNVITGIGCYVTRIGCALLGETPWFDDIVTQNQLKQQIHPVINDIIAYHEQKIIQLTKENERLTEENQRLQHPASPSSQRLMSSAARQRNTEGSPRRSELITSVSPENLRSVKQNIEEDL